MNEQKLLLKFLLTKLRETTTELYLHRAILMNFPEEMRKDAENLRQYYRDSGELAAKAEREFQPLDELIERSPEESQALLALLKQWEGRGYQN